jgi:hypothetical protein
MADEHEVMADLVQAFGEMVRSKFRDPQAATRAFAAMIVDQEVWHADPGTGEDAMNLKEPGHAPAARLFLVLSAGLLALSAMAGWAGLAFMATLLGLGLASRTIWRVYLYQSSRSEGVGPAIRVLETVRRYLANEDPPQTTAGRAD